MSIASILVRTAFGKGDAKRDMGLAAPEGVAAYTELHYGQDMAQTCNGDECRFFMEYLHQKSGCAILYTI